MGGEEYRRCSIDTLFFVSGSPGTYQIHKRPHDDDAVDDDDGTCLGMKSCGEKDAGKVMDAKLVRCSHQCAKSWNILGDAETGYVLTHGDGDAKLCLVRNRSDNKAIVAPCDSKDHPYTALNLQFASSNDIKTMGSPIARFIGAAADGDVKALKAMIKKDKIDVNEKDWDELTAIIPAASGGHLDAVKYLIKEGADVNAKDKDGITALMEASIMGHTKVAEALLNAGAEYDGKANSEVTSLWLAAGEGRTDIVKLLLKKGADASNTRVDGITALMTASVSGHEGVVKLLLGAGADPKTTDGDGLTCLHNGAENGTVPVLKAIMENFDGDDDAKSHYVDIMSTTGFSALIIAAAHGHAEAVRYLIKDCGADPSAVHDNGVTALMYAAASGQVDVMKVLLEEGKTDVNQLHTNAGSALLEASTGNSSEAISFLLGNGAKDDLLDDDGVTPLMAAASQGALEGMEAIITSLKAHMSEEELKEHINLASYSGGTSVMFAAAGGHAACTKRLLELGAQVNDIAQATPEYLEKLAKMIEDGTYNQDDPHVDGVTAFHVAAQGGHLETVNILIEAGAEVGIEDDEDRTPLMLAVKGNYGEVASALVEAGADPNTPYLDEDGVSHNLLMDAIIVENEDFARLLIESGADLYHEDEHKVTTLLQASHRGMKDIVKLLLEKHLAGASNHEGWIDVPSDEGITPLIAASSEGHMEVVDDLVVAGKANVDISDKDGTNSLMAASARGNVEIVEALLKAGAKVNEQNADGHTALMFAYNGKNQVETLWERYKQFMPEPSEDGEVKDDGGTGELVREAFANHTKMVDALIKGGADQKIKDKEGHVAKDFDFHPDADAEVLDQEKAASEKRDASRNEL